MSDQMQMPGNSPEGEEAMKTVENNRSVFNPTDAAMMKQQGQLNPDMTVGMFMENVFGVKWEDPVQKLIQSSQKQLQNRTALGKAQNMAGQRPPGGMPGQGPGRSPGRPPAVPPQPGMGGQGNPMMDIMNQLGGTR